MFHVYILKNEDDRIYIGQTKNIDTRLNQHNNNEEISTKNRGSWSIIHTEKFETRSEAMRREKSLKSGQGRQWIKEKLF